MHQEKKLFIRNVDSESAGRYTCTIINKAGSDYRNFLVSVYHPPSFDNTKGAFSTTNLIGWIQTLFRKNVKFSNFGKIYIKNNTKFKIFNCLRIVGAEITSFFVDISATQCVVGSKYDFVRISDAK